MNKHIISDQLVRLGLSDIESKVYLYLLEHGAKTPLRLSREMNINRTKIYRTLDDLSKKRFVEESLSERGKRFKPAPPENFELLLESDRQELKQKETVLQDALQALSQFHVTSNFSFEIQHYRGSPGLEQMMWNELKAPEVLLFAYENINALVGNGFAEKHKDEVAARNIKYKEIGNNSISSDSNITLYNKVSGKKGYQYRQIPEKILKIRQGIAVYNSTVAIYNWQDKEYVGIEIINAPLTETVKQIFWHYWTLAK